ncbi:unnamed protein product [Linum tenue]|uniref:Fucosyltransferase n=1 Tax=Linum tenue TaxID=586396 RepID=A0AAV0MM83_9ROSI|nr:unnamed protein product [Linum tenue]
MGVLSNLRNLRNPEDGLLLSSGSSSPAAGQAVGKRKWSNFLPVFIALVVLAEIAFLGRLDMAKNAAARVDSWADSFLYQSPPGLRGNFPVVKRNDMVLGSETCEDWLEREDDVAYSRDFDRDPILVAGAEKEWRTCSVGCQFGYDSNRTPDALFGMLNELSATVNVHRSMESAQYYPENDIATARRWLISVLIFFFFLRGYRIVMTTSLSSDVPVGYFSWAEYDIMAPPEPKTEKALAAAFISNCGARNFRLQVLDALEKLKIPIDSYGACHRNRDGRVNKVEALKHYKFSLAFENSNEEDYVTEKFFQSLVAGTIPVVVGAPNIQDYAPGPGSVLHIKSLEDVETVAKTMNNLSENPTAYNQSLRWKFEGPSDSFKALVDMAAVHSSCRLCIHLATMIHDKEESSPGFKKRPCRCTRGSEIIHHVHVRERGRFKMESIFLRSGNLTVDALEHEVLKKFKTMKHVPIWRDERPESIRGGEDDYKVYRVYPVGLTQRQALYSFKFSDIDLQNHLEANPCAKLEAIFV